MPHLLGNKPRVSDSLSASLTGVTQLTILGVPEFITTTETNRILGLRPSLAFNHKLYLDCAKNDVHVDPFQDLCLSATFLWFRDLSPALCGDSTEVKN